MLYIEMQQFYVTLIKWEYLYFVSFSNISFCLINCFLLNIGCFETHYEHLNTLLIWFWMFRLLYNLASLVQFLPVYIAFSLYIILQHATHQHAQLNWSWIKLKFITLRSCSSTSYVYNPFFSNSDVSSYRINDIYRTISFNKCVFN